MSSPIATAGGLASLPTYEVLLVLRPLQGIGSPGLINFAVAMAVGYPFVRSRSA